MSKEQFKFPVVDNEYYEKKYSGIDNSLIYDETKDKETIRKEGNSDKVLVWDTFLTDQEVSSISSAINIIGETIDNIWENEWNDDEQKQHWEETMKHLGRLSNRLMDIQGRELV